MAIRSQGTITNLLTAWLKLDGYRHGIFSHVQPVRFLAWLALACLLRPHILLVLT